MTRRKESYDAGGWWRQPLALLPLKIGSTAAAMARAAGVARLTTWAWTAPESSQNPILALRTALVIEMIRHGSSQDGADFLVRTVNRAVACRGGPVRRASQFMAALYAQPPAPPDYSWALFIESLMPRVWRGCKIGGFKDREGFIEFAGRWRHPRRIAVQLNLPDPRLPNFDDSQIPAKDFDPRGKPWQDPPPQPTQPTQPPQPNQPPTPPVPIAGFG